MKLIAWDIDKGGRKQINAIIDKIYDEDADIVVITGFRTNHNKELIIDELKNIGYQFIVYKKPISKFHDTVLIASYEEFTVEVNNDAKKDSFLIIKYEDIYVAGMNFTNNIAQKNLIEIFNRELSEFRDKKLIVAGNMQTAKNYATKNSLEKKLCKKYIDFSDVYLKNSIEEMVDYNPNKYTWNSKKGGKYNVDFILINEKMEEYNLYCYHDETVKNNNISSHSMIVLNIANPE